MKITALVENVSKSELTAKHALSLYIETEHHKILFDVGSDNTLFENAEKRNIDISKVDTVIISHGHVDHGGALPLFLDINDTAKIYVQKKAFEPHFSSRGAREISLVTALAAHDQVIAIQNNYKIDDELSLFTVKNASKCHSAMNDTLYDRNGPDDFSHEQNLIITENRTVLIMGCGHNGIVNIMEAAEEYHPTLCVGGYHLINPTTKETVSSVLLDEIVKELSAYPQTQFYTCHCTGEVPFRYLSEKMNNLHYLSCGESIEA